MRYEVDWNYINSKRWCKDPWWHRYLFKSYGSKEFTKQEFKIVSPIPLKIIFYGNLKNYLLKKLGKKEYNFFLRNFPWRYEKALKANTREEFWKLLDLNPEKLLKCGWKWNYMTVCFAHSLIKKVSFRRSKVVHNGFIRGKEDIIEVGFIERAGISTNYYFKKREKGNEYARELYTNIVFPNYVKYFFSYINPEGMKNYLKEIQTLLTHIDYIAAVLSFHLDLLPFKPVYPVEEFDRNREVQNMYIHKFLKKWLTDQK